MLENGSRFQKSSTGSSVHYYVIRKFIQLIFLIYELSERRRKYFIVRNMHMDVLSKTKINGITRENEANMNKSYSRIGL